MEEVTKRKWAEAAEANKARIIPFRTRIMRVFALLWFTMWVVAMGGFGLYTLDATTGKTTRGSLVLCIAIALFTAYVMSRMLTWRR